jgi:hypothetical protein
VFSQTLFPKTAAASPEKPSAFIIAKVRVFEGVETLFLKSFHEKINKEINISFLKEPFLTGKSVLSGSLPKNCCRFA